MRGSGGQWRGEGGRSEREWRPVDGGGREE